MDSWITLTGRHWASKACCPLVAPAEQVISRITELVMEQRQMFITLRQGVPWQIPWLQEVQPRLLLDLSLCG